MKTSRTPLFLLLLAVLLAFAAPRMRAQEEATFDYFYDNLKPYGEWIQVADYGLCWRPTEVDEDWAPYTDGYWAYTDAGWTWVSYEEFGDIVYHYGRWVRVEGEGWCWVPDTQWGPAWVSWRNSDEYVGWAPLPPEATFEPEVGISVWVDETYDIGPQYYSFCRVQDFGAPVIREVCFPRERSVTFYRETVNITNISFHSGQAFCGGPRYDFFATRVTRPIPTLRLVRQTNITNVNINVGGSRGGGRRGFSSVQRGNALLMPAPRFRNISERRQTLANLTPTRTVPADRVMRGWSGIKPQERDELRREVKQQTRGATPQTARARPVAPAELKPLPTKVITEGPAVAGTIRGQGKGKNAATGAAPAGTAGNTRPGTAPGEGPRKGDQRGDDNAAGPGENRGPGKGKTAGTGAAPAANERPAGAGLPLVTPGQGPRKGDQRGEDNVAGTGDNRGPGKGKTAGAAATRDEDDDRPGRPAPAAPTAGDVLRRGGLNERGVVPPARPGVVTRPGGGDNDGRIPGNQPEPGKNRTTTPQAPITTVPQIRGANRGDDTPVTRIPPATTGARTPLKRFDDDQPRTAPTRPTMPVQPPQQIQRVQPSRTFEPPQQIQRMQPQPSQGIPDRGMPPSGPGFKRGATNVPSRGEAPEVNRAPRVDIDQIQRQQAVARQQQAAAAQQQAAVARQQQQNAAAAAASRNRADDGRERQQAQAQAVQRQAAAMAAARERVQAQPRPQVQAPRPVQQAPRPMPSQIAPVRPPVSAPVQESRGKDKDKDDKKR